MYDFTVIRRAGTDPYPALLAGLRSEFASDDVEVLAAQFLDAEAEDFHWESRIAERGLGACDEEQIEAGSSSIGSRSWGAWRVAGTPRSSASMATDGSGRCTTATGSMAGKRLSGRLRHCIERHAAREAGGAGPASSRFFSCASAGPERHRRIGLELHEFDAGEGSRGRQDKAMAPFFGRRHKRLSAHRFWTEAMAMAPCFARWRHGRGKWRKKRGFDGAIRRRRRSPCLTRTTSSRGLDAFATEARRRGASSSTR